MSTIKIKISNVQVYKVDEKDLPKKYNEKTIERMLNNGKLDSVCLDYEEYDNIVEVTDENDNPIRI